MRLHPTACTVFRGKQLKIWKSETIPGSVGENSVAAEPGRIVSVEKDALCVSCGSGILRITELQQEGKKRMSAAEYLRGVHPECGEKLG